MIRVGLPQPLIERVRRQLHTLRLCAIRLRYATLRQWQAQCDAAQARVRRIFSPLSSALRVRQREREMQCYRAFIEAFDDVVDVLCMAAREEAPERYRDRYLQRRATLKRLYSPVSGKLAPYQKEWGLPTDPFAELCAGDIETVIHKVAGIDAMMTMRGILEAYQSDIETALKTR